MPRTQNRPLLVWSVQSDLTQSLRLRREGRLLQWVMRAFLSKRVDHFITVSLGSQRKTQTLLGASSKCFTVIPNSIDIRHITEIATDQHSVSPKQATCRLISIGRLHPAKGINVLLYALSFVNKRASNWECWILGDGPERQRLAQLSDELGLSDYVHFAGYVKNPYAWLRTADVFISSSRWETFGISIAEAMALGVPVIATATDGAVDIIADDVDGLLVQIGDKPALAEAIVKLMCEPALRQRLGAQSKLKARQFDASVIAQRHSTVLKQLLNRDE